MIKIELIRFEAQDVITASGVVEAPKVEDSVTKTHSNPKCSDNCKGSYYDSDYYMTVTCKCDCNHE